MIHKPLMLNIEDLKPLIGKRVYDIKTAEQYIIKNVTKKENVIEYELYRLAYNESFIIDEEITDSSKLLCIHAYDI